MAFSAAYSPMDPQISSRESLGSNVGVRGRVYELSPIAAAMEAARFIRCDSMDLCNDPRYFTANVIDKRLGAFSWLAIISTLLLQNAIDQSFDMRKDLNLITLEGLGQTVGFTILTFTLFANTLGIYVGVAQPYFTYRLMTAGPTGFEMAVSFYLNKTIVYWRHVTIKMSLWCMPFYLFSCGFRFLAKFPRDLLPAPELPDSTHVPLHVRAEEFLVFALYMTVARILYVVHKHHENIFKGNYELLGVQSGMSAMQTTMQNMMMPRGFGSSNSPLDV